MNDGVPLRQLNIKLDPVGFWLHSFLTARITAVLASSYRSVSGKEFLAGLLHEIGKPIVYGGVDPETAISPGDLPEPAICMVLEK